MTGDAMPRNPGLGRRAARGALVTVSGQIARIVIQLASVIVLSRLLAPHDYGLMAMGLVVVGVGEIFRDFGLSSAAIQAPHLSKQQRDNLFWINTAIGILLALIVIASAPLLALAFRQPDLEPLVRILAGTFVLNGLATQYRADRTKALRFGVLAASDLSAALAGLTIAILGALAGWGYWALAAQQLTTAGVSLAVVAISARWIAGPPRRGAEMGGLLRFGWHMVGTQLTGYLSNNIDTVLVGIRFGTAPLGYYNRAYQLLMQPLGLLRAPTTTVALPVLSRLHAEPLRFAEYVVRGQLALGYTLVAGLGFVAGAATPLVTLMLGSRWIPSAPILTLFAAAGAFQTLAYVGYWIYLSRGLTGALFRYTLVTSLIKAVCIVVGSIFGIYGVAIGFAVAPAIAWPLSIFWLSRLTPIPTRTLMTGALRMILLTSISAGAVNAGTILTHGLASVWQCAIALGIWAAVYALAFAVVPIVRRDVRAVLSTARLVLPARAARA